MPTIYARFLRISWFWSSPLHHRSPFKHSRADCFDASFISPQTVFISHPNRIHTPRARRRWCSSFTSNLDSYKTLIRIVKNLHLWHFSMGIFLCRRLRASSRFTTKTSRGLSSSTSLWISWSPSSRRKCRQMKTSGTVAEAPLNFAKNMYPKGLVSMTKLIYFSKRGRLFLCMTWFIGRCLSLARKFLYRVKRCFPFVVLCTASLAEPHHVDSRSYRYFFKTCAHVAVAVA